MVRQTAVIILCLLFGSLGCQTGDPPGSPESTTFKGDYPIEAVATVGMVADIVSEVGGSHVSVSQIMKGPQTDPHSYKPTTDDAKRLLGADIVFYCGLKLEGKMTDALSRASSRVPVFAVAEALDKEFLLGSDGSNEHFDPHVWMDVSAWSKCVQLVADRLSEFDPDHRSDYQENARTYRKKLEQLHQYGIQSLSTVPESQRILITSHDAFNYFGKAYQLEVEGIQGISTESEAGLLRINQLVDLIVERKIAAVFVESSVSQKNIESLIEGARARGHSVKVGGRLFSDAMGPAGQYEGTYIGMLDHNITVTTRALGGKAAQSGMQGKLKSDQ